MNNILGENVRSGTNSETNRKEPGNSNSQPASLALSSQESVDNNVGFLLHDAARLMRVSYDRKMGNLGLTRSQWWVLTHLYFHDGVSQTELSSLLEIERPSLGRLIDRLEEKGWVERRADPEDRRVKRVYLTNEVDSIVRTMREHAAEVRGQALTGFQTQDIDLLIKVLKKIKSNLLEAAED